MRQILFRLGLRPRPSWGAYSAHPNPLAGFKDLLLRGERGGEGMERERRGRKGKGAEGRGRKYTVPSPTFE